MFKTGAVPVARVGAQQARARGRAEGAQAREDDPERARPQGHCHAPAERRKPDRR